MHEPMSSHNVVLFLISIFLTLTHSKQIHGYSNSSHIVAGCIEVERQILLNFKQGLHDPYGMLSSWHGRDCCKWSGVGCSKQTSHITKLDIRGSSDSYGYKSLEGKLNPLLFELKYLHYLDLSCNNFESSIPSSIGSMRSLRYLNLSSIVFSGMVPPQLGNLSNLLYLDLNNYRNFGGSWVDDLNWLSGLPLLKYLNLGSVNHSSSSTSWLRAVSKLSSIEELHFPDCDLHDLIPQSPFISNFTSLLVLNLMGNLFDASLPTWLLNVTTLTHLNLGDTKVRNFLDSTSWKHLCDLHSLDLSNNGMSDVIARLIDGLSKCSNVSMEELNLWNNNLHGELPQSLGQLKNLRYLDMSGNKISGSVPASIGNLSHLTMLFVASNELNGTLLDTNIRQLEALLELHLMDNNWVGMISDHDFIHLKKLKLFSLSSKNKSLAFDVDPDWVPSFSLTGIHISNCQMNHKFPLWLRTQTQVTSIRLDEVGLKGEIPSWFWKETSLKLTYLSLANNRLSGKLPRLINLKFDPDCRATLDLRFNSFEGSLPIFQQVSYLFLRNNSFSGRIPAKIGSIMPNLTELVLSENYLDGNIPTSLGKLTNLRWLSLSSNSFGGKIPQLKSLQSLARLDLSKNQLVGRIPKSLCSLPALEELILNNNNLSGDIAFLKNCNCLQALRLGENHFVGKIPGWIVETMPDLSILSLRGNSLTGPVPEKLCELLYLHILDLAHNNLSGQIPSCVSKLTGMTLKVNYKDVTGYIYEEIELSVKGRHLRYTMRQAEIINIIDLSRNSLKGEIPEGLTNLSMLGTLNLSHNQLTGNLPEKMGSLTRLETLDLSSNHLSGPIPTSFTSMTGLSHLNLSYNNLSGQIPSTNQFLSLNDDTSIYEGNFYLCGSPWLKSCSTADKDKKDPQVIDKNKNDEKYFDMLWFIVGIVFGVLVGFWVVCGSLVLNKLWRYRFCRFVDKSIDVVDVTIGLRLARWHSKWKAEKN